MSYYRINSCNKHNVLNSRGIFQQDFVAEQWVAQEKKDALAEWLLGFVCQGLGTQTWAFILDRLALKLSAIEAEFQVAKLSGTRIFCCSSCWSSVTPRARQVNILLFHLLMGLVVYHQREGKICCHLLHLPKCICFVITHVKSLPKQGEISFVSGMECFTSALKQCFFI